MESQKDKNIYKLSHCPIASAVSRLCQSHCDLFNEGQWENTRNGLTWEIKEETYVYYHNKTTRWKKKFTWPIILSTWHHVISFAFTEMTDVPHPW